MEETEVMYNALSELSVLKDSDKFDVDVFFPDVPITGGGPHDCSESYSRGSEQ